MNLTEARSLSGIIKKYNAPTAETLSTWTPQRGIYLAGITDITNDQLSNADAVNNNINKIEILGGNMNYDSYTILKKLYDIKEAQSSANNLGRLDIALTGVHWTPYTMLEKGYQYNEEEASRYYIDNGHYQLIPYAEYNSEFSWETNIANKSVYIKDANIEKDTHPHHEIYMSELTSTKLFEDLAENTEFVEYHSPDETGNEVPRITGDVFINNDTEIDEGWIRNTLQAWYPELRIFVKTVKKAYSAQFI